jgi:ATP adenylyltransferase
LRSVRRTKIVARDGSVEGFNTGINSGEVAGQTIDLAHVHLIPRRNGDVENRRGGVRAVIPGTSEPPVAPFSNPIGPVAAN